MCPIHHKVIDDDIDSYTVSRLKEIKASHEEMHPGGEEPNDDVANQFILNISKELWGKRLTKEFEEIYGKKSRYVIPVISENYPEKIWTNFEMDIIRREADNRNGDFILPLRIDNTQIFGIPDDVGYIDLKKEGFEKTIDLIIQKLKEDPCINIK